MNFSGGIFGIDGALEAAASRRAKGTAERMYATKQITCRADPFRVEHIESLTAMLFEDSVHLHDRCVAGFLLMLVSLRARSSDAHRIAKIHHDSGTADCCGFIECSALGLEKPLP